jgi:hypothetical protein
MNLRDLTGKTVHVLRHGLALCPHVEGVPGEWPEGQLWVGFNDPQASVLVSCKECRAGLEMIPLALRQRPARPTHRGEG